MKGNRSKAALTAVEASSYVPPFYPWHQGVKALSQGEQTAQELTWAAAWKADTRLRSLYLCETTPVRERQEPMGTPARRRRVETGHIADSRSSARPALQTEVLER